MDCLSTGHLIIAMLYLHIRQKHILHENQVLAVRQAEEAEILSANSVYSSSVMRVLTTRLRWGVLYRFRMVKTSFRLPHGCGGISGVSRISRVWGRHSPTRFPQGQNERKANFGTAVESCSKKLPDCRSLATATFSGNL